MTNYKEIIRLHSLGLNKTRIAESCGCARSTVITALHKAEENGLSWNAVKNLSSEEVTRKLYPATSMGQRYSMPDYEWVHKEMQKSGVTLSLLWVEYCEMCLPGAPKAPENRTAPRARDEEQQKQTETRPPMSAAAFPPGGA